MMRIHNAPASLFQDLSDLFGVRITVCYSGVALQADTERELWRDGMWLNESHVYQEEGSENRPSAPLREHGII